MTNIQYATWRKDKPAEAGFSHELISKYSDKSKLDSLDMWPQGPDGGDIKTLSQAFQILAQRLPNHPWLGSKVQTGTAADGKPTWGYEWMTVAEALNTSKLFGAGLEAKGLIPETQAEGRSWKMLGI